MLTYIPTGQCDCGADDCERCHPGSCDMIECAHCGYITERYNTGEWDDVEDDMFFGVCPTCAKACREYIEGLQIKCKL